jgi:hypothetical protein
MGALSQIASAVLGAGTAAPAVRRPVFEVRIGTAPASQWKEAVVSFTVEAGLAPAVDAAEVFVSPLKDAPSASLDDSAAISAGYEDAAASAIFQGKISAIRVGIRGLTRLTGVNGGAPLARLRISQGYEQRTAGEIVTDLAGRASVDTDNIEDGVTYPFYAVDDGRSVWQHIASLARKNGLAAWLTTEGKLTMRSLGSGSPVQTFTYAQDIQALEVVSASSVAGQVTAIGEGAAGTQGGDAWAWLVEDASSITAQSGSGDPARLLVDASLRSADAARRAASGAAGALSRSQIRGRMLVPGAPSVTAGSVVAIAGAPQDSLDGQALVERVIHRYSKAGGFTTVIGFSLTPGGGAGGLGGLAAAVGSLL